jgi:hypothetical protein
LPFPDDVRRRCQKIRGWESKRKDEVGGSNLVRFFPLHFKFGWFINLNFRNALNRASVMPSHTSSPAQSVGTIPSQRSNGSASGSGSGSRHGSASTVFIPADEDMPDMGSTISSVTRSSFRSVPMESPYHLDSFHSTCRPRSINDTSLPSHGQEFLSPADARITIAPSRSSSLRHTSSMTDLDEYASAAPTSESYQSGSAFDMPLLPSRGPSSASSRSQAPPRTIRSGSSIRLRHLRDGLFRTYHPLYLPSRACCL